MKKNKCIERDSCPKREVGKSEAVTKAWQTSGTNN